MATELIIEASPLPEDFCPETTQEAWTGMVATLTVTFPGEIQFINYGFFSGGVPDPADQDKPWVRLNGDLSPDRTYSFFGGKWVSPHPVPPDGATNLIQLYDGDSASLDTFDGGSAGAVSYSAGPMWEIITDFENRVPIGAGATTPLNTNQAEIDVGTPALEARGVNFVKRTARVAYSYP